MNEHLPPGEITGCDVPHRKHNIYCQLPDNHTGLHAFHWDNPKPVTAWIQKHSDALAKSWAGTLPITAAEEYYGDAYYFIDALARCVAEVEANEQP